MFSKADQFYQSAKFSSAADEYEALFSSINIQDCDSTWLRGLHKWGMSKIFTKDKTGFDQLNQAEVCAESLSMYNLCARFMIDHSEIHKVYHDMDAAKKTVLEALKLKNLSDKIKGEIYGQLALSTRTLRNDSCRVFANKAIAIAERLKDTTTLIAAYSALSIFEKNNHFFHKAIEFSQKSLQYQKGKLEYKRPQTLFNIASLFIDLKDYKRGQTYIDSTLLYLDQNKYKAFLGRINFEEARILEHQGDTNQALSKYKQCLALNQLPFLSMRCHENISRIEANQGNLAASNKSLQKAILLCKTPNQKEFENKCILLEAKEAFKNKGHNSSLRLIEKLTTQKNLKIHLSALPEIRLLLAKNYQSIGNAKKSLREYRKYYALKDSLDDLINKELVYSLESKYITAQQDLKLKQLKQQNELQDLSLTQQRWKGFSVLAFLILFSAAFVSLFNQNNKIKLQTATISEAVAEKNILLKEIHHRVKNNLQVISSLFKLQSRHVEDKSALVALQEGRNRVNTMAILHQNLYQEDNLKGIEMSTYINQLCDGIFQSTSFKNENIVFKNEIAPLTLDIDTVIPLGLILTEFISKSLKLDHSRMVNPFIKITLKEEDDKLILKVVDNGSKNMQNHSSNETFSQKIISVFSKKLKAIAQFSEGEENIACLEISKYKKAT